jgi:hypothetical protein
MFYDHGCHGEVQLGPLPPAVKDRLQSEPGEWLEYEATSNRIVVRHVQPTSGPDLPIVVGELVQLLSEIPVELHQEIEGGDFYVHTEDTAQLVRLHVESGGGVDIRWAQPNFTEASKRPYEGRKDISLDPHVHCLNGVVTFTANDPSQAAKSVQNLADRFEGLYPQGVCEATVEADDQVRLKMKDLNLDAHLLIEHLRNVATPSSLAGRFVVSSFGESQIEDHARVGFEGKDIFVQNPVLWADLPQ